MLQRFAICILLIGMCNEGYAAANTRNSKRKASDITSTQESLSLSQKLNIEEQMIAEHRLNHPLLLQQKTHDYSPQRKSNLYSASDETYPLSRSKIEDFIKCKACFYIDRKHGTGHPAGFPFSLNIAVDNNMKNEFDEHRKNQTEHPYCTAYDKQAQENGQPPIHAIPFQHSKINEWRNSRTQGLRHTIPGTNIEFFGGVDDIWQNRITKELYVVDYKATSKKGPITLDATWQNGYKRQMAMYQYLLRQNLEKDGYKISNTGFFVYGNAKADKDHFDDQLNFDTPILAYEGDDSWVEPTIISAYQCLQGEKIPASSDFCDHCQYAQQRAKHEAQDNAK